MDTLEESKKYEERYNEKLKDITIGSNIEMDDLYLIGDAFLDEKTLVYHHINSFNETLSKGMKEIIEEVFKIDRWIDKNPNEGETEEDKKIAKVNVKIDFRDTQIGYPTYLESSIDDAKPLMPIRAIRESKSYNATIKVTINIETYGYDINNNIVAEAKHIMKNVKLCRIPIMIKSDKCSTKLIDSPLALEHIHEDPNDIGGYFIVNGNEWVIETTESILFNQPRIFRLTSSKDGSIARCEFISKPNDGYANSNQVLIRYYKDFRLSIEINRDKLAKIEFPFYVILRLLGWSTDEEIIDNIVYETTTDLGKQLRNILINAYEAHYKNMDGYFELTSIKDIIDKFVNDNSKTIFSNLKLDDINQKIDAVKLLNETGLNKYLLPHVGQTDNDKKAKREFIAYLIRKLLMVHLEYIDETDRDTYLTKRFFPAGISYTRTFKTLFNGSVIQKISSKIIKIYKKSSFYSVQLNKLIDIDGSEFESALEKVLDTGKGSSITINKNTKIPNRLTTKMLNRSNECATRSDLRTITSKDSDETDQSERAISRRKVHSSTIGFADCVSAPANIKAGINKQMAIFATIISSTSSIQLREQLSQDTELIKYEDLESLAEVIQHTPVFVNGYRIGFVKNPINYVNKYRKLRRTMKLNSLYITIHWDENSNEVHFWCDKGRIIRPVIIVYNNRRDKEKFSKEIVNSDKFVQGIGITQKILDKLFLGDIDMNYLLVNELIEFITPEEQANCFIASTYDELKINENNYEMEYTHCDIPQSLLGLPCLTSPYCEHNDIVRILYQSNQIKQTCGYLPYNWAYRCDKNVFLQYITENPLVGTATNKYMSPIGLNAVVAIMIYTGYNNEDALIISKGAVERGMYNGCKFTYYSTIVEDKEKIGMPHMEKTKGIGDKNYSKLEDGLVRQGSVLKKNDVIISKYYEILKINENDEKYTYEDVSVVYKEKESCIVHDIIRAKNKDNKEIIKVVVRKIRPIEIGDKFCIKPNAEILTENGWIKIKDINIKEQSVITMNKDGYIYYQYPSNKYIFNCDNEDLFIVKNKDLHIECTMNHKLYISMDKKKYELIEAKKIKGKNVKFKKSSNSLVKDQNINIDGILLNIEYKKCIPNIVWYISQKQCREIINKLLINSKKNNNLYYTDNLILANELTRLALHGGLSATIKKDNKNENNYIVEFCFVNEPEINYINKYNEVINKDKINKYSGEVMCIEVPESNIFYYRETQFSPPCWIGNSSRMGQKGICARVIDDVDMPFTEDGIIPAIIMSPHSIPTRMTMGQLMECLTSNLCAYKGSHIDATIFRKKDINQISKELEDAGYHKYGYRKLYSGITGEPIDSLIFMGPTYYQRLHKFVKDTMYSRQKGPTNPITLQPLSGKSAEGGLRLGEMEKDILTGQGVSRFLTEKMFHHGDKFTEYICRCGLPAIVNEKDKYEIYKCIQCGDKADIVKVPTSWTCKLFVQYLEAMNIGVRRFIEPFTFEKFS